MSILPPDLQSLLDQIDAADRAGAALAASATDEQFQWRPLDGRGWSIAQCLDHLAIMNRHYGTSVRRGIQQAKERGIRRTGPGRSTWFGRQFAGYMEPPVKIKGKAPRLTLPRALKSREDIMRAYHEAHDFVRQLIREAADIDTTRATFQNPFIPVVRMRVSTGLAIIAAHDRRHLWQAEQVKLTPGYPPAAAIR
jgi:hypothetical protein